MGKRCDITLLLETRIRVMIKSMSHCNMDIALCTGVSKRAMQRIKAKMHIGAALRSDWMGKCGRKRMNSAATDRMIQSKAFINPHLSAHQQTEDLQEAGDHVSHVYIDNWSRWASKMRIPKEAKTDQCNKVTPTVLTMESRGLVSSKLKAFFYLSAPKIAVVQVCFSDESHFKCHDVCQPKVWHKIGSPKTSCAHCQTSRYSYDWVSNVYSTTICSWWTRPTKVAQYPSRFCLLLQLEQWYPDGKAIFMLNEVFLPYIQGKHDFLNSQLSDCATIDREQSRLELHRNFMGHHPKVLAWTNHQNEKSYSQCHDCGLLSWQHCYTQLNSKLNSLCQLEYKL